MDQTGATSETSAMAGRPPLFDDDDATLFPRLTAAQIQNSLSMLRASSLPESREPRLRPMAQSQPFSSAVRTASARLRVPVFAMAEDR